MPGQPLPVQKLFGYEVVHSLGTGAGSQVYAVKCRESLQVLALKHVSRTDAKSVRFIDQLVAECNISQQVSHPVLRKVIERKQSRNLCLHITEAALLMELVVGRSLSEEPPRLVSEVLRIFEQIALGLEAMHKAGFVHCDLKPGNIMLCENGNVKLIDLGQACRVGTIKPRIQGTPDFISPEQVHCHAVTPKTDIYNFGAAMYWTLTGQFMPTLFRLKKGDNSFFVDTQIKSPAELNPTVPQPVSDFVMQCVRTNPSKRPADMQEVLTRLAALQTLVSRSETRRQSVPRFGTPNLAGTTQDLDQDLEYQILAPKSLATASCPML